MGTSKSVKFNNDPGFTLLELLIAVSLTTLVVFMISSSLSFTSRIWLKSEEADKLQGIDLLVDQMNVQLGSYYVFDSETFEGLQIVTGSENSIVIATSHSVKALHGGAPVLAKYEYDSASGKVRYSEMLFDSSRAGELRDFANESIGEVERAASYKVDAFSFEYVMAEGEQPEPEWNEDISNLRGILVMWRETQNGPDKTRRLSPRYLDFLSS